LGGTTEREGSRKGDVWSNGQDAGWDDPGRLDKIGRYEPRKILHGNDGRRSLTMEGLWNRKLSLEFGFNCGINFTEFNF
jgi:hypothetical protein